MNERIPPLSTETLSKVFSPENLEKNILYVSDEDWRFLNELLDTETIRIKYYPGSPKLVMNNRGDWCDLYVYEDVTLKAGEFKYIPLGIAMELPEGYEGILAPRSSTFKRWGLLQANSIGIFDHSFCGDGDEWKFPAYATRDVTIPKGTRICQFRILKNQPPLEFKAVESLGNANRGGYGTSGA